MADELKPTEVVRVMRGLANLRWAKATAEERAEQARKMVAGRRKAARKRDPAPVAAPEALLSLDQARQLLGGVGRNTVRRLAERHPEVVARVGRLVKFRRAELLRATRRG